MWFVVVGGIYLHWDSTAAASRQVALWAPQCFFWQVLEQYTALLHLPHLLLLAGFAQKEHSMAASLTLF